MSTSVVQSSCEIKLRQAGIRPTRQRLTLAERLFADGDRHVTAEDLFALAQDAYPPVSLATVYNTLKQFSAAGLVREVAAPGHTTYFDTNTSDHHHYYLETEGRLIDIEETDLILSGLPETPLGKKVGRIDVIVHLTD